MTALNYTAGTVSLTNGSAVVTGVDTAWQIALIVGGTIYVEAAGNPLPIDTVDSDTQITAAIAWAGATGVYNYVLRRSTTYDEQVAKNAEIFARLVAELEAGTIWKYDASGDTAGKAFYDTRPKGFSYLDISGEQPVLWVKASNDPGDWAGPFSYGVGPKGDQGDGGPYTEITAGPVTTIPYGQPATVTPVQIDADTVRLDFEIPKGQDGTGIGDMLASVYDPQGRQTDVFAALDERIRVDAAQSLTPAEKGQAIANIDAGALAGFRNLIINPLLGINQRQKSGTVVLAAGVYGHDRFKAGAGGCTYTFSTNNGVTTFNISAGSIQQVIGAENIAGRQGEYVLSWSGTAQGRINGGSYGATGVPKATLDGSANVTVEWSTGTLSLPQLEREFVTDFSTRAYPAELHLCQYYAFTLGGGDVLCNVSFPSSVYLGIGTLDYPRDMRAAPSFSFLAGAAASLVVTGGGGGDIALSDFYLLNVGRKKTQVAAGVPVALSQWGSTSLRISTSPILLFNAEI